MKTGGTPRRTLLQRGLALLAGGVAVAASPRLIRAKSAVDPKPGGAADPKRAGTTLTVYARKRPLAAPPDADRGVQGHSRQLASGELLDAPDGKRLGAFYTNCFCLGTAFGPHNGAASNLEFQVLQLKEGTLFGMCGGATEPGGARAHAVVGGTDRYAGARGVYVERPATGKAARHDVVEFIVTLAG
jgi:hypothetical protein